MKGQRCPHCKGLTAYDETRGVMLHQPPTCPEFLAELRAAGFELTRLENTKNVSLEVPIGEEPS